jgi:hypothetical protein
MALLLGSKQAMRAYSSARLGSPWMRTRKQLLAFCKGEQCLGRPGGRAAVEARRQLEKIG